MTAYEELQRYVEKLKAPAAIDGATAFVAMVDEMFDLATESIREARDQEIARTAERIAELENDLAHSNHEQDSIRHMIFTFAVRCGAHETGCGISDREALRLVEARITSLQEANSREVGARHDAEEKLRRAKAMLVVVDSCEGVPGIAGGGLCSGCHHNIYTTLAGKVT